MIPEYQKLLANTNFACSKFFLISLPDKIVSTEARRGRLMLRLKDPTKRKPRKEPKHREITGSFQKYLAWERTQPEAQQVENK